jgi:hypothetical protein
LADFREIGSVAVKGAVAVPLVGIWTKLGPPPDLTISILSSLSELLAIIWVFTFWYDQSGVSQKRRMKKALLFFCIGVIGSLALIEMFSIKPSPDRERVVEGFVLQPSVKPLLGPTYSAADALRDHEFDSTEVWTKASVTAIHTLMIVSWLATFVSLSVYLAIFVMAQRRRAR